MTDKRLPLFQLSPGIFNSLNFEDVQKTSSDMWDLGIFHPPFPSFFIKIKLTFARKLFETFYKMDMGEDSFSKKELMFEYNFYGDNVDITYYMSKDGKDFVDPIIFGLDMTDGSRDHKYFEFLGDVSITLLVVLLATKNIQKDVQSCNKPNSRNRRERTLSKYSSVTTISIGKITETMRSNGNGGPVRPHLRRGHIRNQHYGKGNAEVKKIFIQPMFVNADQGWIDSQKEYQIVA